MATVFYSWQSESPGRTNRNLIEKALENCLKTLAQDATIETSPRLDKDTMDVPGAPDIAATIFEKIDRAAVFVCDVTLINRGADVRPTPNPNVLVELGYALARLGWGRIVMVLNEASGPVEDLPFDLNKKRALVYRSHEDDVERAPARDELRKRLEVALRAVFEKHRPADESAPAALADVAAAAIASDARDVEARVTAYMKGLVDRLDAIAPPPGSGEGDDDRLVESLAESEPRVAEFGKLVGTVAQFNHLPAARAVYRGFERLLERYTHPVDRGGTWYDTDFDFYRFIGHELFVMLVSALVQNERWEVIGDLLDDQLCIRTSRGPETWPFQGLSEYIKLLEIRSNRLNLQKPLLRGEILKERHERAPIANVSGFDEFVDAEFFLFLRAELAPEKSPLSENGVGPLWRVWTASFMGWKVPTYLVRAERARVAMPIISALGLLDIPTFRMRFKQRAENVFQFIRGGSGFYRLGKLDVEKFGRL